MVVALGDIRSWHEGLSCTPTALAAISGKTPDEIGEVLREARKRFDGKNIPAKLRADYDINHWLQAVIVMGGDWTQGDRFDDINFEDRPTINEWMANHMGADLELVFCDDGDEVGHVFATMAGDVVDTYTKGRRIKFDGVPNEYSRLRVKRAFIVFERERAGGGPGEATAKV